MQMSIIIRNDVIEKSRRKIYNKASNIKYGILNILLVVIYVLIECLTIYEIMTLKVYF